jgi:uncharacterized membrane protein HdeD (DUF308 family)
MTTASGTADQAQAMMAGVAKSWGLVLVMGILSIILGILAFAWPGATIVTVAIFFAVWLFVSGIYSIIGAFSDDASTSMKVLSAIIGVLSVIVGFSLLRTPFQAVEVMIFVLGIFWVSQGIVGFVTAFEVKKGRNWRLFSSILGVVAGIVVLVYPISSALTLALFGGIWLVILGITQIIAAFELRGAAKAIA